MDGITMNNACMYDEVAEIRNLNKVEGFDPRRYMRLIQNEGQAGRYYLDVAYRKLWFRLRYPEGKIVKKILKLTEQVAIVEARVYLNRNDDEDKFISNALAQKYVTADEQFGNKFVELAETAAVGRALSDAGFGLQFADREGEIDPEVTEAPLNSQMVAGTGGSQTEDTYMDFGFQTSTASEGNVEEILQEEIFSEQDGMGDYISMPGEMGQAIGMTHAMQQTGEDLASAQKQRIPSNPVAAQGRQPQPTRAQPPIQGMTPAMQSRQQPQQLQKQVQGSVASENSRTVATAQEVRNIAPRNAAAGKGGNGQGTNAIRRDMPVEQIYSLLNRDSAAAVVIPMGFNKGKTLGQVAVEKPANLQWYVDSYGGPDNLLRAAAKFLMDAAFGQAG